MVAQAMSGGISQRHTASVMSVSAPESQLEKRFARSHASAPREKIGAGRIGSGTLRTKDEERSKRVSLISVLLQRVTRIVEVEREGDRERDREIDAHGDRHHLDGRLRLVDHRAREAP